MTDFSEMDYDKIVENIFTRFPSFQSHGSGAYHPGRANMQAFDTELGHPHRAYRCVHVAGTNGKGSVSSMIASSLAARGFRTGLYTSPHLVDFRERARICDGSGWTMVPREFVAKFCRKWGDEMDRLYNTSA